MDICLIMDNPETPRHPVIARALQKLSVIHRVRLLDVGTLTADEAQAEMLPLANIYLLKSHAPQALAVAHTLEEQGALVVNSWSSTLACQDRELMTQRMEEAGLPWPQTWSFPSLKHLLAQRSVDSLLPTLPFPLMMKSRYSRRGDLVDKLQNIEQVQSLLEQWGQEPVLLQEFVAGDGWDLKVWVIDQQIFAARRRTPLETNASKEDYPLLPEELPRKWREIVWEIGRIFQLQLYGVDLLSTKRGPMVVDVNAFPGFRGVPGADDALVALVEQMIRERQMTICT